MVVVLAPLTYRLWTRFGFGSFIGFVAVAIAVDLAYFAAEIKWLGWSNFFWVWLAVTQLGYAWRDNRLPAPRRLFNYCALGMAALAALIAYGPYPLAMVGSPDEGLSNTSPPKVTLIALAIFQFGLLMAIEAPMRRVLENLRLWTATVFVNSMIMTVYLWHITAMAVLVGLLYLADGFGLGIEPGTTMWWLSRPLWIIVLFIALVPLALLLSPLERHARRPGSKIPSALRQVCGAIFICLGVTLLALYGYGGGPFPRLDLASFSMVIVGAGISGLLPTVSLPRLSLRDLRVLGIWLIGAALVYSAYTYVRITKTVSEAQAACFDNLGQKLAGEVAPEHLFQQEYNRLQTLVEQSLVARAEMLDIWNRLRVNYGLPITSRDLATLKLGSENYLKIRGDLYSLAHAYECGVTANDATLAKYNIDPKLRLQGVMRSLGAALTLFDNYMLGVA